MLNNRSFAAIVGLFFVVSAQAAYAQPPLNFARWTVVSGLVPSEAVRVCLPGVHGWKMDLEDIFIVNVTLQIVFLDQGGNTLLSKGVDVPREGFRCVETSYEELVHRATQIELSGRIQWEMSLNFAKIRERYRQQEPGCSRDGGGGDDVLIGRTGGTVLSIERTDTTTGATKGTVARLLIDKGFGFIRDESGIEHFPPQ